MTPRVSVLVNTYNHEKFIAQCLQSVLTQDFPASQMEIIVVDDGSTDSTPQIIQTFLPRIRYIRKENGGQVSAFHAGVAEARGEIIAFLDGDDWWATEKLTKVVAAFDAHPNIACVGHAYYEVDEAGSIFCTMTPTSARLTLENPSAAQFSASLRVFLGTSRFAIRRSVLGKTLPVPEDLPFFDNFVFSQAIAIGGALLLEKPLCYYRLHSKNLYASTSPDQNLFWTKYRLLSTLLAYLPARLASFGVSEGIVEAFLGGDCLEADRLRLKLLGGKHAETFRVERACFRLAYRNPDLGYRLFNSFVLGLTLLFPPQTFYRLRDWYAKHNLRRFRQLLGEPVPVPAIQPRREYSPSAVPK